MQLRRRWELAHARKSDRAPIALQKLEPRRLLASPIVITKGGTYSGTWESQDPQKPAVIIATTQPVIIENSTIRSRSDLIVTGVDHANLTVRKSRGYALNPNVLGQPPGRFIDAEAFNKLIVENNDLEGTAGIFAMSYAGNPSASQTVRIVKNRAHNIDGRLSNGSNGWLDYNRRTRISDGRVGRGYAEVQFVQLSKFYRVANVEIAWNQVINDPGNSRVEDNISIYKSSGTEKSPIRIHDNYIQGAYTIKPAQGDSKNATWKYDWSYSGGGIMLGDGVGATSNGDAAYVQAYDNQVISTTNYGIAIAAGHDLSAYNNRVVSCGVLADGKAIVNQNVGVYVWDSYKLGKGRFFDNYTRDNLSGWVQATKRNDWWSTDWSTVGDNTHWLGTVTHAAETNELKLWKWKLDPTSVTATTGKVAGMIFHDLDNDGMKDSNEPGIAGLRVFLDFNFDGDRDGDERATVSSSTGRWEIGLLPPGKYVVRISLPSGYVASGPTSATLKVAAGQTVTRYFAIKKVP